MSTPAQVADVSPTVSIIETAVAEADFAPDPVYDNDGVIVAAEETSDDPPPTADSADAGPETPKVETPEAEKVVEAAAEPVAKPDEKPAEKSEAEDLKSIEAELLAKTPGLKNGKLSVLRHQAVLTRQRRQAEEKIAEATAKYEAVKTYDTPETKERLQAVILAEHNPPVFFEHVLMNDPRYQALVEKRVEAEIAKRGAVKTPEPEPELTEPEPDVLLQDGTLAYSAARQKELMEYHLKQRDKAHQEELKSIKGEIEPFARARQDQESLEAAKARQSVVLKDARELWNGFAEHEKDIRAELGKPGNERMTLRQAYMAVVPPRLKAAADQRLVDQSALEAELRKKVIDDINKKATPGPTLAPGATSVATRSADDGPRDTATIIRESLRNANL